MEQKRDVVLVTGGSGLVGKGIQLALEEVPDELKNNSWIFLTSKDGDLRFVLGCLLSLSVTCEFVANFLK